MVAAENPSVPLSGNVLILKVALWLILVLNCCWIAGCSGAHELETAPVTGTVTLDGKAIDKGTIVFAASRGRAAAGEIRGDGTFTLSTYGVDDGAIVGENKVAVFIATSNENEDENAPAIKSPIPERYASPSTSGLSIEVKAGESNEFVVALKSKE